MNFLVNKAIDSSIFNTNAGLLIFNSLTHDYESFYPSHSSGIPMSTEQNMTTLESTTIPLSSATSSRRTDTTHKREKNSSPTVTGTTISTPTNNNIDHIHGIDNNVDPKPTITVGNIPAVWHPIIIRMYKKFGSDVHSRTSFVSDLYQLARALELDQYQLNRFIWILDPSPKLEFLLWYFLGTPALTVKEVVRDYFMDVILRKEHSDRSSTARERADLSRDFRNLLYRMFNLGIIKPIFLDKTKYKDPSDAMRNAIGWRAPFATRNDVRKLIRLYNIYNAGTGFVAPKHKSAQEQGEFLAEVDEVREQKRKERKQKSLLPDLIDKEKTKVITKEVKAVVNQQHQENKREETFTCTCTKTFTTEAELIRHWGDLRTVKYDYDKKMTITICRVCETPWDLGIPCEHNCEAKYRSQLKDQRITRLVGFHEQLNNETNKIVGQIIPALTENTNNTEKPKE